MPVSNSSIITVWPSQAAIRYGIIFKIFWVPVDSREKLISLIKKVCPSTIVMVDNC